MDEHEALVKEFEWSREVLKENWKAHDNLIVTLATAAIGVSVTIINGIVKLDTAIWMGFLYTAWFSWVVSIFAMIISYYLSSREMIDHQAWIVAKAQSKDEENIKNKKEKVMESAKLTYNANMVSSVGFAAGVLSFICFLIINLESQRKCTQINQIKEECLYLQLHS